MSNVAYAKWVSEQPTPSLKAHAARCATMLESMPAGSERYALIEAQAKLIADELEKRK